MSNIPRFLTDVPEVYKGKLYLHDDNILHHARQVLRLHKGDKIEIFDGQGTSYLTEIEKLSRELLIVNILEEKLIDRKSGLKLILAQALPKAGKLDTILRMNTEIGVNKFVLFDSDYSVVKLKSYHEKKMSHLSRVIKEATRQSLSQFLPDIQKPVRFEEMLNEFGDVKILLHTKDYQENPKSITNIKSSLKGNESVLVVVGPEGGFSEKEVRLAKSNGFYIVGLNLPVLRTETAGLVVSSFLLIE